MPDILLIDDDIQVLKILSLYLSQAGHVVTTASNGLEGMRLLSDNSFDLIITDILMPEYDGLELLLSLRKSPAHPKVIAMSGGSPSIGYTYALDMAKNFSADKVLAKPLDYNTLTQAVRDILAA